ncbi:flagellin N-terminal helical domain-containing protein [Jeotgalibaca ciconiae]|uniref:Flagellin n=1 Tax=Jeotgalibaca ciconiae TaxID=2496265 RepID=A0A3Q9BKC0_9LACT|nr:flagellin [Jeotgalibaca ciconiae]AZP04265.1 flagellin [Jeotgalibaca ciconiae]
MRINTNISAMNTYSRLTSANASKSGSLAKLSSGLRINKAGDDAAGLAISEKMKNQVSGLTQATRNAQDGISLIQTAEGALKETHTILNRMRDLTLQAKNGTNTTEDRDAIQKEMDSLTAEIDRIAGDTEFNKQELLNGGDAGKSFTFQIGANAGQEINVSIKDMSTSGLFGVDKGALNTAKEELATAEKALADDDGLDEGITEGLETTLEAAKAKVDGFNPANVSAEDADATSFDAVLTKIDDAISSVSSQRADLGAVQNRLDHTISNLSTTKENLSEANSRIVDVDMAEEMMSFTKSNILSQAATAMLAQANQMPQGVLQLLQ